MKNDNLLTGTDITSRVLECAQPAPSPYDRRDQTLWCGCSACQEHQPWKKHSDSFSEETLLDFYWKDGSDKFAIGAILSERKKRLQTLIARIDKLQNGGAL